MRPKKHHKAKPMCFPEKLIPGTQIDLVRFNSPLAEASDDFTEKTFTGPIWKQIRDVLDYINTTVIEEKVVKVQGKAEVERYFNYPYNALEEVVVNAVFHKSYRDPEPVEARNGSPMVEFETDPERTYLITTLNAKEGFGGRVGKTDRSFDRSLTEVLIEKDFVKIKPMTAHIEKYGEIAPKAAEEILGKSTSTVYRYLGKLVKAGVLEPQGNTNDKVYVRKK